MTHEPWLVLLSILLAIQGGYVGLQLAIGSRRESGSHRRLLLAGSALTLAIGIWSMHFVGMLAAALPREGDFLVLPTLISFLTCVIVVGIGILSISMSAPGWLRLGLGAISMGGGICLMHYIGMSALHADVNVDYKPLSVVLALAVAIVASGVALWMLNRTGKPLPIWLAAIVLGVAVSGMHYTAMAGTAFTLCETPSGAASPALTRDTLAIIVTCIAFSVSGGFLLSLVPDRNGESEPLRQPTATAVHSTIAEASVETHESAENLQEAASAEPVILDVPLSQVQEEESKSPFSDSIPVEKDGRVRHLRVSDIRSIRANAHYTYVSDGQQEFFCKLSISAIEERLDPHSFMRVHRSYIISIDHVGTIRRHGENGLVALNGALVQCDIPVARARLPILRKRFEEHLHLTNGGYSTTVRE